MEYGLQLNRVRNVPEKALKLLKVLDRKAITAQLLIDTKIGKSLTAVSEKEDPERETADDPQLLDAIKKMKEQLKSKWMSVHQEFKRQQQKSKSAAAASQGAQ